MHIGKLFLVVSAILIARYSNVVLNISLWKSIRANSNVFDEEIYIYHNDSDFKSFLHNHHRDYQKTNLSIQKQVVETYDRENATFVMLCRNSDVFSVLEVLQNVEDRFNKKYHYDYTFLNDEPFSDEFIYLISSYVEYGKLNFGMIAKEQWSYPSHLNITAATDLRENFSIKIPYGRSESYRHMCRYYSGFFYKHEMVRRYEFYWRIEPDIKLYCDIDNDLFRFMKQNNKKYGFVISLFEYMETIPTLWTHVVSYINDNKLKPKLLPMLMNDDGYYNLCHFWSNFEIARVDAFDNPEYDKFFQYLDRLGGFFYERWGDAPVHTIGMMLTLDKQDLHWFDEVGYYHPPYTQCPLDSEIYVKNRCVCDQEKDVTWDARFSCINFITSFLNS